MDALSYEMQIAVVSAASALAIGGLVALFGAGPVLSLAGRAVSTVMRRKMLSSLGLGALTTVGMFGAQASGLEPAAAADLLGWLPWR